MQMISLSCSRIRQSTEAGLREETTADIHRFQLLQEELVGIRNTDLAEIRGVVTAGAHPDVAFLIGDCDQTAALADVDFEVIGGLHHAFLQKGRGAVRDDDIAFHLAEAEAAITGSTFGRLAGQHH